MVIWSLQNEGFGGHTDYTDCTDLLLTSKDTETTENVDDNVVIWPKTFCKRAYNTLLANHNLYSPT